MKKFLFAAALLALTACGGHKAEKDAHDSENVVDVEEITETDAVVDLKSDSIYRPGIAVEGPTILDFNATWCPPCQQLKPVFHAAAVKYPGVKFVSIDVDNNPETAAAYGISAIPTVIFINADGNGKQFVGTEDLLPAEKFDALVQELIK